MERLAVQTTKHKQIVDITDLVNEHLRSAKKKEGLCHLCILHTTAALTTADLDQGTDLDMLDAFQGMIPKLKYRHPHNPSHVGDHIMSSLIGPSVLLPFEKGKLILGTWQRIVLVELDGLRDRGVVLSLIPS